MLHLDVMMFEDGRAIRIGRLMEDGSFVGEEDARELVSSIIDRLDPVETADVRSLFREVSRRLSSGYIYCRIGEG